MSKFVINGIKKFIDEDGHLSISLSVIDACHTSANLTVEEMKGIDNCVVEIKKYKSQRSIEQNNLLWALLGKLAVATCGTDTKSTIEECYMDMIEEANIDCEYLCALETTERFLRDSFRVVKKVGEREINGKLLNIYKCYIGSSKFDTSEMTKLIEVTLNRLADLGISDSEIELAKELRK